MKHGYCQTPTSDKPLISVACPCPTRVYRLVSSKVGGHPVYFMDRKSRGVVD